MKKVAVIGCGMVGMSYVYSLMQQEDDLKLLLMDARKETAHGNVLDIEDAIDLAKKRSVVKVGTYKELKDADLLVITAGRPQKPGESRLEMIKDNSLIMKEIAQNVKASGFKGITIVASNPVDCLTFVYQKETGFHKSKVIGSGTVLDSSRMDVALSKKLKVHTRYINSYLAGEHGDSSVLFASQIKVKRQPLGKEISAEELKACHKEAIEKAGVIIHKKRATYYGIGNSLTRISQAVLNDDKFFAPVGVFVKGLHGAPDVVVGYPSLVGEKGVEEVKELQLTSKEKSEFLQSAKHMKLALEEIGY